MPSRFVYPVHIHKDADPDSGVSAPDLPGCASAVTTIEEAFDGIREAIACHIEGLLFDGEQVPLPQPCHAIVADGGALGCVGVSIPVELPRRAPAQ